MAVEKAESLKLRYIARVLMLIVLAFGVSRSGSAACSWIQTSTAGIWPNSAICNIGLNMTAAPTGNLRLAFGTGNQLAFDPVTSATATSLLFGDGTGYKLFFGKRSGTAATFMTIQDNGSIGMGSTSPQGRLFVVGALSAAYSDTLYSTISTDSAGTLGINAWQNVALQTGAATRLWINGSNGYVGIGTTTPTSRLSVAGSVTIADGSQGAGKVLTSDAGGLASWQTPSGGGTNYWALSGTSLSPTSTSYSVGIGTTTPTYRFQVDATTDPNWKSRLYHADFVLGLQSLTTTSPSYPFIEWRDISGVRAAYLGWGSNVAPKHLDLTLENGHNFYIAGGNVGIGTATPTAVTSVVKNGGTLLDARFAASVRAIGFGVAGTSGEAFLSNNLKFSTGNVFTVDVTGDYYALGNPSGTGGMAWGVFAGNGTAGSTVDFGAVSPRLMVDRNGNVSIGVSPTTNRLEVAGNTNFSGTVTGGNIAAKYQDLAEWVPSGRRLEAGTVVVLEPARQTGVSPCSVAYDTKVAGVVSERPGVLLGEEGADKSMVATTGRVKVRVDASHGAIQVGDLLVTSDHEGFAMKSEPIAVAGVAIHRPGTLIGKALEPLEKGKQGEILVLLSLQ